MSRFTRMLAGLTVTWVMFSTTNEAFTAENVWSVEYLNSRKSEWEQLIGPTIRIEGRVTLHGKGQLRLAKCDLTFHATDAQLRSVNSKRTVELAGRFKKIDGKVSFEVTQILAIPTDLEEFESRSAKFRNPRPDDWYELGDWATQRSQFYDDAELLKKSLTAYANGIKVERRSFAADDAEARFQLASKAKKYNLPDDLRADLSHEGYRLLWQASLKDDKADAETWRQLAIRITRDLPGCEDSTSAFPAALKQRYDREPITVYRESPEPARKQLNRILYAAVSLKAILQEASADGRNGDIIADRIEQAIPEERQLAEKYRDLKLGWRLSRIATATRQEVEQLARDYSSRQQPQLARQAFQLWLQAREKRMRDDGPLGLLQLADEYLALLKDEPKAVTFLKEASKLDPSFADVSQRLHSLGYEFERGEWRKESAPTTNHPPNGDAASKGAISVGMSATAIQTMLGSPNSKSRAITSHGVAEVWCYGVAGTSRLIVHLERSDLASEAKVVEFGNAR